MAWNTTLIIFNNNLSQKEKYFFLLLHRYLYEILNRNFYIQVTSFVLCQYQLLDHNLDFHRNLKHRIILLHWVREDAKSS